MKKWKNAKGMQVVSLRLVSGTNGTFAPSQASVQMPKVQTDTFGTAQYRLFALFQE